MVTKKFSEYSELSGWADITQRSVSLSKGKRLSTGLKKTHQSLLRTEEKIKSLMNKNLKLKKKIQTNCPHPTKNHIVIVTNFDDEYGRHSFTFYSLKCCFCESVLDTWSKD